MRPLAASWLLLAPALSSTAADTFNILGNGGFEYGLMCYWDYEWSTAGQDSKGDYEFRLSTDSHSGAYSVEIRCAGPDCEKAAIVSQKIPASPNSTYTLSLYAKCPAGRKAAVFIPGTTTGDVLQGLICRDDWTLNTVTFKTAPSATHFAFYVYNLDTAWLRLDDLVLRFADGTVPARKAVIHAGIRRVGSTDAYVTVDGKPYLALGFFNVPYEDLKRVADVGANSVIPDTAPGCFATAQDDYADRAYELGVGVVPDSTASARLRSPGIFAPILGRFAVHLSNIAWFLVDEPDQKAVTWFYVPGPTLVAEYDAAKSHSTLPVMVDLQRAAWSVAPEITPYASAMDIWMAEPYGPDFSGVNHAISLFNSIRPRPIWVAQDATVSSLIVPKTYWALIHGATGIMYFAWDDFKGDPGKLRAAGKVFSELNQLKDVIFATHIDERLAVTTAVSATPIVKPSPFAELKHWIAQWLGGHTDTAPAPVAFMARQHQGGTYIIAANYTLQRVQSTFSVPGLMTGRQISVLFEGRTLSATSGTFSDTFEGPSRHVYLIR